ncbi:MAG: cysteine synthase CysM [Saprospiraceae bacterium]
MNKLIDLVGNTPLVELKRLNGNPNVRVLAKLEGNNPGGSVKDRAALNMINMALQRGEINEKSKLIEATSGNTGIALAMMANVYGLTIELVLPSNSTEERKQSMSAFGAKVILKDTIEECRDFATYKVRNEKYYMLDQFSNPDNFMAHYKHTGPEIWRDTLGEITHFVSSMGTTGTIMGTSLFLKEKNSQVTIIGCQPTEGSSIPGIRRWSQEYVPAIYNPSRVDKIIDVSTEQAIKMTRKLARDEAVFCGMSSGGAAHVALQLASQLNEGTIVFICCDRGDRYLSSGLFDGDF